MGLAKIFLALAVGSNVARAARHAAMFSGAHQLLTTAGVFIAS